MVILKQGSKYYAVDDLTADTVLDGEWEGTFFGKPADKNGKITSDEYVELDAEHGGWEAPDELNPTHQSYHE